MAQTGQTGHSIIVTNVTSEGPRLKIWGVCDKDTFSHIETLIAQLGNEFMQRQGLGPQTASSSETTCCVKYRGRYVRARITNIHPNWVIVLLIDSGITDIVPIELVRLLYPNSKKEEFLINCPPLANEFTLANIVSVSEKWDVRTVETIRNLVKDKELSVSNFEKYNSYYLVKLVFGDHDIGNILVNKGMAKMTTLTDMFKPQMYSQPQNYKVPTVPHQQPIQQQIPVAQMPISGYPCDQRVIHATHPNMMPMQQNMNADNWHYGHQPGFVYQQQQQQQAPPRIHQSAPIHQAKISPRKPKVQEDDEDSRSDIFEFRTRLVQVGVTYPAHVSCVEDGPIKFSVQLEENREQLVSLMTELQAHTPLPIKEPPLTGAVCLARLKDERSLCRAVVMATFDTRVKIYFVDFGNTDYVQHTDIYRLPPKFIKPKVLSIRICLPGLKEMNITEEVKMYFLNLVYGKKVELHVCEPDGPFLIQYGEVYLNGRNVKDYLKERFPDIASVTYGRIPALTDGTKEIVFVSHVVSCSKFFVQLEKNVSDLEQMMATINNYATTAPQLKQIVINSICIAPYEVDNQWYRVKILKQVGENVNVLYVDYGNEETVNKNQLRQISRDLVTQMPCQAMLCVLNGFQSRNSKPEFDTAFETLTTDKRLAMTVKNAQQTCLIVDLFDMTTMPPKNVLVELNESVKESRSSDVVVNQKTNEFDKTVPQNHQRFDSKKQPIMAQRQKLKSKAPKNREDANVSTQSNTNPFRQSSDENSRNRTKSWKDDHNEQRHDNRFQQRDESDRNGKSGNFNRDASNRSFNRDGGSNNSFGRDEEGTKKDGENHFGRDGRNERFNTRDGANNSFERDGGNKSSSRDGGSNPFSRDSGNDRYNRDGGNDRFNRDGGNDRFNRDGGNDRFNRDGGNDRFNRNGGNDRFNKDGNDRFNRDRGNDRFNRDGGNDRFNKDGNDRFNKDGNDRYNRDGGNDRYNRDGGNDRFNRSGGNDRFNKDGAKTDRNNFRDGGKFNQYSQHDNRDDRNRGNKFSSKRDASDNESTSSKGSGKRGEKGGFQGKNDRDFKTNQFNKFGNDNDGFKPKNYDDNSRYNSKPKYGRDSASNDPKEINFDESVDVSKPKTLEFALPSITLGNKHRGEIVYLSNLSSFYVHLIPENEKLEALMEKIASVYDCGGVILESSKVKLNLACIAQYAEDDRWYRAVIKKIEGSNATVLFIDYGNVEVISFNKLKEITEEFTTLTIQAVHCKLFGPEKTEWTEDEINSFSDMVNEKLLEIEFIAKDQDMFKVLLREVNNETTMPEIINATFCPGVDLMKAKENVGATKVSNVSQQKSTNAVIEFASLDSKWIDEQIKSGTKDTVIVTWFDNGDSFYCQSVTKQKEFRPMMEEIQKVYPGRKTINETLKPGCPVIAIFAQDGALYRAEIVEVKGNRSYLVQYVDFGNKATVEQRRMFPVEKRFMIIPKQVVRCSLKNIVPVDGGCWTNSNSQGLEQYLYDGGEFECTYHEEKDNKYLISLSHNKIDIANALVEKKHAMLSTSTSAPKSTETEKITTDKPSCDITSRLDIELLPGQTLRVKVSSVESVSKFHIQFSSADYCNQAISSYMSNNDPKVMPQLSSHEMCLGAGCLIFKDGFWRRAVIVNCCEKISFDVKLIDTGAYDKISLDRVLALPSQLAVMQNQAIECSLHNIEPSSSLDEKLKKLVLNKEVMIYVESVDKNRLIVELYDSIGCKIQLNDASPGVKISSVCPMPILSSTHKVSVSCANHSNSLWLQMMNDAEKDDKLNREMSEFYTKNGQVADPIPNKLCVVESNGTFCRGKIIKKTDDTKVLVNLIDHGFNENHSCDKLKVLDSRFNVPHQLAIHVSLNVTLDGSPAEQVKALKPHLIGKEFTATFYNVHKKWIVELVENGVKLSETLTGLNLVKEVTTIVSEETDKITDAEKFGVQVSHADSPAQFWIQRNDEISQLKELENELHKSVSGYAAVDKVLEEGSLCAVISDGVWYRAEVIDADEEIATVRFIDYGKTDVINNKPDNIKSLPDSMKAKKIFGIKCRLDVMPFDSEEWSDTICKWMGNLKSYKNLEASLIVDSVPKRIDLFIDGKSVVDTLVEEGKAVKVHHEEDLVEELVDVELDPRSAFISHINSPNEFYVQEEKSCSDLEKIQDRFIVAHMFQKLTDVNQGTLCVAKYIDNDWYRARVISQGETGTKVLFIDYGNNAEVTEIRAIPDDVASIPPLARKCSLQKPYYATKWPEDAFDNFCELSADGATIFLLDVLKEGETAIVKLTLDNQDIAEKLAPSIPVFVCNINTPTEFWIQKEQETDEIDKLQEKLLEADNYSKIEIKEGLVCAAKFPEDDQWYRGRIVSHNENETIVLFIDYGNSSSCTEIRALPEDIAAIKPFAKKCSLQLPSSIDEWSKTAFDDFCNISGDGVVPLLIDVVEENDPAIVNLFFEKENIVQKLISKKEKIEEKLSTIVEDVQEQEAVAVKESIPEKEIVREQEVVPAQEVIPQQEEITEKSAPIVFISQINSVQEFWVQQEDCEEKLDDVGCKLCALEEDSPVTEPKEGSVYAALFSIDDAWYRGKVLSSNETETEVFFIDYGNSSAVKDLRVLSEELRELPALAKKCSLKLPSNLSEWPKDALKQLSNLSADGTCPFTLQVLEDGDLAIVDLILNGESVTEKLLESVRAIESKPEEEKNDEVTPKIDDNSAIIDETPQVDHTLQAVEKIVKDDEKTMESNEENAKQSEDTTKLDQETTNVDQPTETVVVVEETTKVDEEKIKSDSTILLWNIISPSEFWGQVGTDSANVQGQLSQADEWKTVDELKEGLVCAAKVNEKWHRARIETIKENEAEVFLIDQGYTRVCAEFHQLPSVLITEAPLSKKYSLQLPENVNKWSQSATTAFSKYSKLSFSMEILQPGEISIIKLLHHDEDVAEILASMRDDCSSVIAERPPPEGEENLNMAVSNVISPSMFWGQTELDLIKLEDMEKNLANVATFNPLKNFDIGRICAAQFPDDGNWYRAKILSHSENATEVIYVDFGNKSTTTELRILPQNLISMEYLSTQYSLRKPSDIDEWSKEACDKFVELIADGTTYFEYKILDQEKKEVQLIYQGTDVVELLAPLCTKVVKENKEGQLEENSTIATNIEVIDLTDENTSFKENIEDKNVTTSSDSAFHSENVDSSHEMEIMETPVEKKSQEFSSTFEDSDQRDDSLNREGSDEKLICPELTPDDIISKMTPVLDNSINDDSFNREGSEEKSICPELTPDDIISKMTPILDNSINLDDEKVSKSQENTEDVGQKNVCESEDNIVTSSVTTADIVSEKMTDESKENGETIVTIITTENITEALPEVEIIDNCKHLSHDDKIVPAPFLQNQSIGESQDKIKTITNFEDSEKPELNSIISQNDETISECQSNAETTDNTIQKSVCEAEDNLETCQLSASVSENQSMNENINDKPNDNSEIVCLENITKEIPEEGQIINRRRSSIREEKILPGSVSGDQLLTKDDKIVSGSVNGSVPSTDFISNEKTTDDELVSTKRD